MKKFIFLLLGALLLTFTKPAFAIQFKTGDNLIYDKATKIDETILISGNNIEFDSTLNGDLLCAGRNITITGNIKGDVLCAGQNIKVNGVVDGDVRVAGQSIGVEATISRNLYVVGQDLNISPKSNIKGDVLFGAQTVDMSGIAGRDLAGAGEKITLSGSLLRNAILTMTTLNVTDKAKVGGNLDYFVEQKTASSEMIISNKTIKGEVRRHDIVVPEKPKVDMEAKVKAVKPAFDIAKTIYGIISFTLLAFVLLYFNSYRTQRVLTVLVDRPVISGLLGLVILVIAPIAMMILCITLIGMPIAFVVFVTYLIALFTASLYTTIWIGNTIMTAIKGKTASHYLSAFVGCLVVGLLSLIPILGWVFLFITFLVGLGATFISYLPGKTTTAVR